MEDGRIERELLKFVRFMDIVGDQKLVYNGGVLCSPGCEGDYQRCSRRFDLDRLADLAEEYLGTVESKKVEVTISVGR